MATVNVYVSSGASSEIEVVDGNLNTVITTLASTSPSPAIGMTPNFAKVYCADASGFVNVIATVSNTITATPAVGSNPQNLVITPDGKFVYVMNQASSNVSVIDTSTDTVTATVAVGTTPLFACVTPDSQFVYVPCQASNAVYVIATATQTVVATVLVGNLPSDCTVTPDGKFVYVSNLTANSLSVITVATNTVLTTISLTGRPHVSRASNDAKTIYTNVQGVGVSVIDVASNTVTTTVPITTIDPNCSILSAANDFLFVPSGTAPTIINCISTATNTVTNTITLPLTATGNTVYSFALAFSGAKLYLASGTHLFVFAVASQTFVTALVVNSSGGANGVTAGPPPVPTPTLTIPKLFIPRTGLQSYDESDFDIDWRALERWGNSWAPTLFFPNKPGRSIAELTANWVQLEVWAQGPARQKMIAGGIGSAFRPLLVPRKDSDEPADLTVNWNTIQLWANAL